MAVATGMLFSIMPGVIIAMSRGCRPLGIADMVSADSVLATRVFVASTTGLCPLTVTVS